MGGGAGVCPDAGGGGCTQQLLQKSHPSLGGSSRAQLPAALCHCPTRALWLGRSVRAGGQARARGKLLLTAPLAPAGTWTPSYRCPGERA